jgi:hypothetical protein
MRRAVKCSSFLPLVALTGALLVGDASSAHALGGCNDRDDPLGWYVPDRAKLQTGGYLGLVTVAVGYSAFDVLDFDLYYGWVPEAVGGIDIHSVAARAGVRAPGLCLGSSLRWTYLQGGIGGLMTFGKNFFVVNPSRYPGDYYYPVTALRAFLSVGTALEFLQSPASLVSSHGVFVEVSALDEYLVPWIKNAETISLWDVWSLSVGYQLGY